MQPRSALYNLFNFRFCTHFESMASAPSKCSRQVPATQRAPARKATCEQGAQPTPRRTKQAQSRARPQQRLKRRDEEARGELRRTPRRTKQSTPAAATRAQRRGGLR